MLLLVACPAALNTCRLAKHGVARRGAGGRCCRARLGFGVRRSVGLGSDGNELKILYFFEPHSQRPSASPLQVCDISSAPVSSLTVSLPVSRVRAPHRRRSGLRRTAPATRQADNNAVLHTACRATQAPLAVAVWQRLIKGVQKVGRSPPT